MTLSAVAKADSVAVKPFSTGLQKISQQPMPFIQLVKHDVNNIKKDFKKVANTVAKNFESGLERVETKFEKNPLVTLSALLLCPSSLLKDKTPVK